MRAISLTQPWASLIAIGAKQWETRDWPTFYRGQIAIHASKKYPKECRELTYEEPFMSALKGGTAHPHDLPLGAIVALGTITDCQPTERFFAPGSQHKTGITIGSNEWAFGDYHEGRFAFHIENALALPIPIPCKGALSIWTVPDDVAGAIYMQLVDMKHDEAIREEARGGIA